MADFIIIGILFVLSTAAGFISGNTENGLKRQKWFFIGPGIVFAGIAALMGWMAFRMCELKELLFSYVGPKIPQVSEKLPLELTSNVIPDSLIYWIFSVIALLAVLSFLVAFNCRRSAKNPWISIGGIVCASAIFNFGSVWAFYGIGAFLVIFGKYSRKYPTGETSIAVLVFLTLFCIIWTWYSFSGKRFGWKVLLTQLGIFAMSLAVCWLLALAVAYPYANKMKMRTERENAVVFQFQA